MASIEELEKRKRNMISIHFYNYGDYTARYVKILARKIIGIKDDKYELGEWETLYLGEEIASRGSETFFTTSEYGEFGFSFDIMWGKDWPYSGCFWNINDGKVKNTIYIDISGGSRNPEIRIEVDGKTVVDKCNSAGRELIG